MSRRRAAATVSFESRRSLPSWRTVVVERMVEPERSPMTASSSRTTQATGPTAARTGRHASVSTTSGGIVRAFLDRSRSGGIEEPNDHHLGNPDRAAEAHGRDAGGASGGLPATDLGVRAGPADAQHGGGLFDRQEIGQVGDAHRCLLYT